MIDMYSYETIRARFEVPLVVGMAYCMAFKLKDYGRAKELAAALPA